LGQLYGGEIDMFSKFHRRTSADTPAPEAEIVEENEPKEE
jgi:hypothetical protein